MRIFKNFTTQTYEFSNYVSVKFLFLSPKLMFCDNIILRNECIALVYNVRLIKDNVKDLNSIYYVTRIHACMQGSEQPSENSTTLRALTTGPDYKAKKSFLYNTMTDARKTRYFCCYDKLRDI